MTHDAITPHKAYFATETKARDFADTQLTLAVYRKDYTDENGKPDFVYVVEYF